MIARPALMTDDAAGAARRARAVYDLLGALILLGCLAAFLLVAR